MTKRTRSHRACETQSLLQGDRLPGGAHACRFLHGRASELLGVRRACRRGNHGSRDPRLPRPRSARVGDPRHGHLRGARGPGCRASAGATVRFARRYSRALDRVSARVDRSDVRRVPARFASHRQECHHLGDSRGGHLRVPGPTGCRERCSSQPSRRRSSSSPSTTSSIATSTIGLRPTRWASVRLLSGCRLWCRRRRSSSSLFAW